MKLFKRIISLALVFSLVLGPGTSYSWVVRAQEVFPEPTADAVSENINVGEGSTNDSSATNETEVTINDTNNETVVDNATSEANTGGNYISSSPTPTPIVAPTPSPTVPDPYICPAPAPTPAASPDPTGTSTPDGTNETIANDDDTITATADNCNTLTDTSTAESDTGTNTVSGNEGTTEVTTGNANSSGSVENTVNTTSTEGSADSVSAANPDGTVADSFAENSGTTDGSSNFTESSNNDTLTVNNTNTANTTEELTVLGNSGENTVIDNDDGTVSVTTGDVDLVARLINILNLNIAGEDFIHLIVSIYGDLTGDFDLVALSGELGFTEDEVMAIANNEETGAGSTNEVVATASEIIDVENNNLASVNNTIEVMGTSGVNDVSGNDGDVSLVTGRVDVLVSLLNFINTNFTGTNWYFAMLNIFGSVDGDILLPDAESFLYAYVPGGAYAANIDTGDGSTNSATSESTDILSVDNDNTAYLENNINATGDTGNNNAVGNDEAVTLDSGTAETVVSLINWVNTNLTGNNWVFLVVNVLGKWVGNVVAFPGVAIFTPSDGTGAWAFLANGSPEIGGYSVMARNEGTGEDSVNSAFASSEQSLFVDNTNEATVVNNIDASAITGQNLINENDGGATIITGDASILAGILNIVNLNVTGRNWMLLFVNIFGDLNGDLVFPSPDLTVSISDGVSSTTPGSILTYTVIISNIGNALARDVTAVADIPVGTTLLGASDGGYQGSPQVHWDLGDMAEGTSRTVTYQVLIDSNFVGQLVASAVVATTSTEPTTNNNTASDITDVAFPVASGSSTGGSVAAASTGPAVLGLSATGSDSFAFTNMIPENVQTPWVMIYLLFFLGAHILHKADKGKLFLLK